MNTPPPELKISREGVSNWGEIHVWAVDNSEDWLLVQRWRKTYGWTDVEYLEVLAVQLLTSLQKAQEILIADGRMEAPPVPPDPEVPPLFQTEEPETQRNWAMVLIALGFALLIVALGTHFHGFAKTALGSLFFGALMIAAAFTRKS